VIKHLRDAWRTIVPAADDPHGPLPGLLVALTIVTGLVDAFSYLTLSRVFVANMTGNVVFLSFDLGGAAGFLWWASLLAIVAFLVGAYAGGFIAKSWGRHRGRHLFRAAVGQTVLVAVAGVLALIFETPYHDGTLGALIVLLGIAMGLQNATARSLAVPDLTTTVLTLTLTGITSDGAQKGQSKLGRRLVSIVSMFVGGLVGTLLVIHSNGAYALVLAVVLLLVVVIGSGRVRNASAPWTAGH
jgi:uncharacterized membrane protein YoaK (UPF0700 family)